MQSRTLCTLWLVLALAIAQVSANQYQLFCVSDVELQSMGYDSAGAVVSLKVTTGLTFAASEYTLPDGSVSILQCTSDVTTISPGGCSSPTQIDGSNGNMTVCVDSDTITVGAYGSQATVAIPQGAQVAKCASSFVAAGNNVPVTLVTVTDAGIVADAIIFNPITRCLGWASTSDLGTNLFPVSKGIVAAKATVAADAAGLPLPNSVVDSLPAQDPDQTHLLNINPCIAPDSGYSVGLHADFYPNVYSKSATYGDPFPLSFVNTSTPGFSRCDCPNHLEYNTPWIGAPELPSEYTNDFGVVLSGEIAIYDTKEMQYPDNLPADFKPWEYKLVCLQHDDSAFVTIGDVTYEATGVNDQMSSMKISCWEMHLPEGWHQIEMIYGNVPMASTSLYKLHIIEPKSVTQDTANPDHWFFTWVCGNGNCCLLPSAVNCCGAYDCCRFRSQSPCDQPRNITTPVPTPTGTLVPPPTATPAPPTATPAPTPIPTPTAIPTPPPTATPAPTTAAPTATPTATPAPSTPAPTPTTAPTATPTGVPTTAAPTATPTGVPTTAAPTATPTGVPTTAAPTATPTGVPTTAAPTATPTGVPTTAPPTATPTGVPTTAAPTATPTGVPTTAAPSASPTGVPTTAAPTATPSPTPTHGGVVNPQCMNVGRLCAVAMAGSSEPVSRQTVVSCGGENTVIKSFMYSIDYTHYCADASQNCPSDYISCTPNTGAYDLGNPPTISCSFNPTNLPIGEHKAIINLVRTDETSSNPNELVFLEIDADFVVYGQPTIVFDSITPNETDSTAAVQATLTLPFVPNTASFSDSISLNLSSVVLTGNGQGSMVVVGQPTTDSGNTVWQLTGTVPLKDVFDCSQTMIQATSTIDVLRTVIAGSNRAVSTCSQIPVSNNTQTCSQPECRFYAVDMAFCGETGLVTDRQKALLVFVCTQSAAVCLDCFTVAGPSNATVQYFNYVTGTNSTYNLLVTWDAGYTGPITVSVEENRSQPHCSLDLGSPSCGYSSMAPVEPITFTVKDLVQVKSVAYKIFHDCEGHQCTFST